MFSIFSNVKKVEDDLQHHTFTIIKIHMSHNKTLTASQRIFLI